MDANSAIKMLLWMLFLHSVADYHLQGCLADMKQYEWWLKKAGEMGLDRIPPKYRRDYLAALIAHAFEWAFMIILDPMYHGLYRRMGLVLLMVVINTVIHAVVDDLKANRHSISLVEDQLIHVVQIAITWVLSLAAILFLPQ